MTVKMNQKSKSRHLLTAHDNNLNFEYLIKPTT